MTKEQRNLAIKRDRELRKQGKRLHCSRGFMDNGQRRYDDNLGEFYVTENNVVVQTHVRLGE